MFRSEFSEKIELEENLVKELLEAQIKKYSLSDMKHERAVFICPFSTYYQKQACHYLGQDNAFKCLAKQNYLKVFIITNRIQKLQEPFPNYCKVIEVDTLEEWPTHPSWQARFYKWGIPFLFHDIQNSIYIDSEILITRDKEKIKNVFTQINNHDFIVTEHEARANWQDEYAKILECKREKDLVKMKEQFEFLTKIKFESDFPICQTSFLGRKHSSSINNLSISILAQISLFSERDQLALPYAIQEKRLRPHLIPEGDIIYTGIFDKLRREKVCFVHAAHYSSFKLHYFKSFLLEKLNGAKILQGIAKSLFKSKKFTFLFSLIIKVFKPRF